MATEIHVEDHQPGEDAMLLENTDEQDGDAVVRPPRPPLRVRILDGFLELSAILGRFIIRIWYSLMGQYFPRVYKFQNMWKSKFLSFLFVLKFIFFSGIICVTVNTLPTVMLMYNFIHCKTKYYDVCYSIMLHGRTHSSMDIPDIVLRDSDKLNDSNTQNELQEFEDFSKVVLFLSSFSSTISYLLFYVVLGKLYCWPHMKNIIQDNYNEKFYMWQYIKKKWNPANNEDKPRNEKPLQPFDDTQRRRQDDQQNAYRQPLTHEQDNNTTTQLTWKEARSYTGVLLANILINLALFGVFLYGQYLHHKNTLTNEASSSAHYKIKTFEKTVFAAYTYSLFCTLASCFLFSKLAYGIQAKYMGIADYLEHVNIPNNQLQERGVIYQYLRRIYCRDFRITSENFVKLYYLQERVKHINRVAKSTLKLFELWFLVHWVLYIVSSFCSLSLFLEAVADSIKGNLPRSNDEGINFQHLELVFLALFSASNCLLFLYPCLRAAAITESHQRLICKINKTNTNHEDISPELKDQFVSFLNSQDSGFHLQILCAKVPFGFSIAYISIFFSLFGVLLKVSTSI